MNKKITMLIGAVILVFLMYAVFSQKPHHRDDEEDTFLSKSESGATQVVKIGQSVTFPDGMKITAKDMGEFTPSAHVTLPLNRISHDIEITLENTADEPLSPATYTVSASSSTEEAKGFRDEERGPTDSPTTSILPGRKIVFHHFFSFVDPTDMVVEVRPYSTSSWRAIFTQ